MPLLFRAVDCLKRWNNSWWAKSIWSEELMWKLSLVDWGCVCSTPHSFFAVHHCFYPSLTIFPNITFASQALLKLFVNPSEKDLYNTKSSSLNLTAISNQSTIFFPWVYIHRAAMTSKGNRALPAGQGLSLLTWKSMVSSPLQVQSC